MNTNKKICLLLMMMTFSFSLLHGQYTHRKNQDKHQQYIDSLKNTPYPWHLPILGAKVRKLGFDIPYPNGLMVNYIYGVQDVSINKLSVGLQQDPSTFTNVDDIAVFDHITAHVNVINFRYDFYIFPFLNLYALGGYVDSKTDVALAEPFAANFTSHGEGPMVGWGTVLAGGVGPIIFTTDYNMAWTFMPQLDDASLAQVFDFRLGHMFTFRNKPEMNLVALIGTSYQKLSKYSVGSVNLSELVGFTAEKKADALGQLNDWYAGLAPHRQDRLEDVYNGMAGWLKDGEDTILRYSFDKKLPYPWSMTIGLNYQLNHRFQFNAIYTMLGSREQIVFGVNYRFGFKGNNLFS